MTAMAMVPGAGELPELKVRLWVSFIFVCSVLFAAVSLSLWPGHLSLGRSPMQSASPALHGRGRVAYMLTTWIRMGHGDWHPLLGNGGCPLNPYTAIRPKKLSIP